MRHSKRTAFTLVELLVVIAIIGILVALLLPAVQAAREAGRRISCSNNLKQIGLAYQNYESTNKALPPCFTGYAPPAHGWAEWLLPFVEKQGLYDKIDFSQSNSAAVNQPVYNTYIKDFVCPSTPEQKRPYTVPASGSATAYQTYAADYHPIRGIMVTPWTTYGMNTLPTAFTPNPPVIASASPQQDFLDTIGALEQERYNSYAQIIDGLSNTIISVENAGTPQQYIRNVKCTDTVNCQYPMSYRGGWADGTSGSFRLYGMNSDGKTWHGSSFINLTNRYSLYGFHPGGAQVALCDGSVRLMPTSMAPRVLLSAVTKDQGEVVTFD